MNERENFGNWDLSNNEKIAARTLSPKVSLKVDKFLLGAKEKIKLLYSNQQSTLLKSYIKKYNSILLKILDKLGIKNKDNDITEDIQDNDNIINEIKCIYNKLIQVLSEISLLKKNNNNQLENTSKNLSVEKSGNFCINYDGNNEKDKIIKKLQEKLIKYKNLSVIREKETKELDIAFNEIKNKLSEEQLKSSVLREIAEEEQSKLRKSREKFKLAKTKNEQLIMEIYKKNLTLKKLHSAAYKSFSIDRTSFNVNSYRQSEKQLILTEQKNKNKKFSLYLLKKKGKEKNEIQSIINQERRNIRNNSIINSRKNSIDPITMESIVLNINNYKPGLSKRNINVIYSNQSIS